MTEIDPENEAHEVHKEVMRLADGLGEMMTERFDEIQVLSDKYQELASGQNIMVGIGAAVQVILHGCAQIAENKVKDIPGHMPYDQLFVTYVNAVLINAVETALMNKKQTVGRA